MSEQDRSDVYDALMRLAEKKGTNLRTTPPMNVHWKLEASQKDVEHARSLVLRFRSGKTLTAFFDQGVGFVKFDEARQYARTPEE